MALEVEGLSRQQRLLADLIWEMETQEEVKNFITSLRGQQRRDAETVLSMIVWAMYDTIDDVDNETIEILNNIFHG